MIILYISYTFLRIDSQVNLYVELNIWKTMENSINRIAGHDTNVTYWLEASIHDPLRIPAEYHSVFLDYRPSRQTRRLDTIQCFFSIVSGRLQIRFSIALLLLGHNTMLHWSYACSFCLVGVLGLNSRPTIMELKEVHVI